MYWVSVHLFADKREIERLRKRERERRPFRETASRTRVMERQNTVDGRRTVRDLQRQFTAELEHLRLTKHRLEELQLEVDAVQLPMSEASGEERVISTERGNQHITRRDVRDAKAALAGHIEETLQALEAALAQGPEPRAGQSAPQPAQPPTAAPVPMAVPVAAPCGGSGGGARS